MPNYHYQGVNYSGQRVEGVVEAAGVDEAKALLRKERVRVIDLREKRQMPKLVFGKGVRLKDVSSFTRQFASMNSSAIPLVQSLDA
ncbi:MAG: hypothetical protein JXA71_05600, partial [Chitinispirillaceae bacterium]|nr:hypothetical protein [Chitinispirillaceae bacterium]